ncbi:MAG: peptidase MA family metallohydrolase [Planctomycetota bacterium]|jgi:hypothetical protein
MVRILPLLLLALLSVLPAQVAVQKASDAVGDTVIANVERYMAEGIRRLKGRFPGTPDGPIRVIMHQSTASMPAAIHRLLASRSPGLTLLLRDEIHIVLDHLKYNPPGDLRTVVEHELVHVLLDQHVGRAAAPWVPRWLHEGLAQALAESLYLGIREEDIVWRVQHLNYLSFADLADGFPHDDEDALRLAYGQSFSYVSFLLKELGLATLLEAARGCRRSRSFDRAFLDVTGKALAVHEHGWTNHVVHGSGAKYRYILRNCFLLSLAAALPLLAFALVRRLRRDETYRRKLVREEEAEDEDEGENEEETENEGDWIHPDDVEERFE